MKYFLTILMLAVLQWASAQTKDETAIRQVLQQQNTDWNKGDIPAFMQGYWQDDSLAFIGRKGATYGWENTLHNYQQAYPDTSTMGKLQFSDLQLRRLSPAYYFIVGKWHLTRIQGDVGGTFTLLFRKIKGKWKIVVDHTS